jgi:hypothetical protein
MITVNISKSDGSSQLYFITKKIYSLLFAGPRSKKGIRAKFNVVR